MNFKRITGGRAVAAYHKTGMIPVVSVWTTIPRWNVSESNLSCGCLMTTLVAADCGVNQACSLVKLELMDEKSKKMSEMEGSAHLLHLPIAYVTGSINGFDGHIYSNSGISKTEQLGYEDGKAAWQAICDDPVLRQRMLDSHRQSSTFINDQTALLLNRYLKDHGIEISV